MTSGHRHLGRKTTVMVKLDFDTKEEGGSKEEEVTGRKPRSLKARGELT